MTATRPDFDIVTAEFNLESAISAATDAQFNDGIEWYSHVRAMCHDIAREHSVPFRVVAGIIATLSSMMPWERNIPAALDIIRAWNSGIRDAADMPPVARSHEPVRKAVRMLNGENPAHTIVKRDKAHVQNWKTLCFYYNITGISTRRVTVDVHMWRIITGDYTSQYRPSGREYMTCERLIVNIAKRHGIRPCDAQAIMWVVITNKAAK